MTRGPGGYGRYNDDVNHIGCPRSKSDMTPCIARDGADAMADDMRCVGCFEDPRVLLTELRHEVTGHYAAPVTISRHAADKLKALVLEVTEPKKVEQMVTQAGIEERSSWYTKAITMVATSSQIQMMLINTAQLHRVHLTSGMCGCGHYVGKDQPDWMRHVTKEQTLALLRLATTDDGMVIKT